MHDENRKDHRFAQLFLDFGARSGQPQNRGFRRIEWRQRRIPRATPAFRETALPAFRKPAFGGVAAFREAALANRLIGRGIGGVALRRASGIERGPRRRGGIISARVIPASIISGGPPISLIIPAIISRIVSGIWRRIIAASYDGGADGASNGVVSKLSGPAERGVPNSSCRRALIPLAVMRADRWIFNLGNRRAQLFIQHGAALGGCRRLCPQWRATRSDQSSV